MADLNSLHGRLELYLTECELEPVSDHYHPGTSAYDFELGGKLTWCSEGEYENRLRQFLETNPGQRRSGAGSVFTIIGGIGSGKTTTARRVLSQVFDSPRECPRADNSEHICTVVPRLFDFDFARFTRDFDDQKVYTEELASSFWTFLTTRLDEHRVELDIREEVEDFWKWLSMRPRLINEESDLYRFFAGVFPVVNSLRQENGYLGLGYETTLQQLARSREQLPEKVSPSNFAWYRTIQLRYSLENSEGSCRCNFTHLDNLDQLHPRLQRETMRFTFKMASLLPSRTIVAIRPLTWKRSIQGHALPRTEPHFSPDLKKVLVGRLEWFLDEHPDLDELQVGAIKSLARLVAGEKVDPLFSRILAATSGVSLRFALRNIENMLQSPILADVPGPPGYLASLPVSKLVRAYFFADRDTIVDWAFENLYTIRGHSTSSAWLVKTRLLHYLLRINRGTARLSELFAFSRNFGYGDEVVAEALQELMPRTRPLVWCEAGFEIDDPNSSARVTITPIGHGYLDSLMGDLLYEEVCLATHRDEDVDLRSVWTFHQELTSQDLREIGHYIGKESEISYRQFYGEEEPSLSWLHAKKLLKSGQKRRERVEMFFDLKRQEAIRRMVEDLIRPDRFITIGIEE